MGKTSYRDGLVADVLQPEITKNSKAGPVILTFGIGKNSGRPMYDLEDFVPGVPVQAPGQQYLDSKGVAMPVQQMAMPSSPASTAVAEPKQYTALCSLCNTYPVSTEPFFWNGKNYISHKCNVSGKDEMLVIEV
jgi:hypothetical protein